MGNVARLHLHVAASKRFANSTEAIEIVGRDMVIGESSLKGYSTWYETTIQRGASYFPLSPLYFTVRCFFCLSSAKRKRALSYLSRAFLKSGLIPVHAQFWFAHDICRMSEFRRPTGCIQVELVKLNRKIQCPFCGLPR